MSDQYVKYPAATLSSASFPLLAPAGSVSAPSYSFSGDSNTGMYSAAGDQINFATAGSLMLAITTVGTTTFGNSIITGVVTAGSGSVSAPSYSFASTSSNTGLYLIGTDNMGFAADGVAVGNISAAGLWTLGASGGTQVHAINGSVTTTVANTAARFIPTGSTVPTNGMYLNAANSVGFASNSAYVGNVLGTGTSTQWNFGSSTSGQLSIQNDGASQVLLYNAGTNFTPLSQETFMYGGNNTQALRISGGNTSVAGGSLRLYGGAHATKASFTEFYNAATLVGSVNASGLWTLGASSGTQVHLVNGNLRVNNASGSASYVLVDGLGASDKSGLEILSAGNPRWFIQNFPASSHALGISTDGSTNLLALSTGGALSFGAGTSNHIGTGQLLQLTQATASNPSIIQCQNTDNTSGTSNAKFTASVGGTSGGDPLVLFDIPSGTPWAIGADNSDSDKFKICGNSSTLGTNDYLTILGTGAVAQFSGMVGHKQATDNVTDALPTQAEMVTALGAANQGTGMIGFIKDANADTNFFICCSNGTSWYALKLTKGA